MNRIKRWFFPLFILTFVLGLLLYNPLQVPIIEAFIRGAIGAFLICFTYSLGKWFGEDTTCPFGYFGFKAVVIAFLSALLLLVTKGHGFDVVMALGIFIAGLFIGNLLYDEKAENSLLYILWMTAAFVLLEPALVLVGIISFIVSLFILCMKVALDEPDEEVYY